MTPVIYHKPFKGASHGDRFRYEITSETPKEVRWIRSDGLAGKCTRLEWDRLYVLAPRVKPTLTIAPPVLAKPAAKVDKAKPAPRRKK